MNIQNKNRQKTMSSATYVKLIHFLEDELALSKDSLALAQRSDVPSQGHLPMILWQYGLITLEELDRIYDWLEHA